MFEWIVVNIPWIFSGIGVVALSFVFKRKDQKNNQTNTIRGKGIKGKFYQVGGNIVYNINNIPTTKKILQKKQSAAFCYKTDPLLVLLVKTSGRKWTFPKGTNLDGQHNYETARINALEEAGAVGKIKKEPFSTYRHYKQELKNSGEECINEIFFLEVKKENEPTEEYREPTWFTLDDAEKALMEGREKEYAKEFSRIIKEAKNILNNEK